MNRLSRYPDRAVLGRYRGRTRKEITVPLCRDMTELATDYLEGALPVRAGLAVRWHLTLCSFCRRHYRQVRATVALLRRLPAAFAPPAVEDQVIARLVQSQPDIRPAPE